MSQKEKRRSTVIPANAGIQFLGGDGFRVKPGMTLRIFMNCSCSFYPQFYCIICSPVPGIDAVEIGKIHARNWRIELWRNLGIMQFGNGLGKRTDERM